MKVAVVSNSCSSNYIIVYYFRTGYYKKMELSVFVQLCTCICAINEIS